MLGVYGSLFYSHFLRALYFVNFNCNILHFLAWSRYIFIHLLRVHYAMFKIMNVRGRNLYKVFFICWCIVICNTKYNILLFFLLLLKYWWFFCTILIITLLRYIHTKKNIKKAWLNLWFHYYFIKLYFLAWRYNKMCLSVVCFLSYIFF